MARRGVLYAIAIVVAACGFLALETGPTAALHARTANDAVSVVSTPNHEATLAAPAARIARAHRPTPADAFLAAAIGAALAAWGLLCAPTRIATRRGEQFYVRRRGPPLHLATL